MPRHSPLTTGHSAPSGRLPRVTFVTSHPIQYQVPVFRELAKRTDIDFVVLFAMIPDAAAQGSGFGVAFEWDIPLLDGYDYRLLRNISRRPSVTKFSGCDTPEIKEVLCEIGADIVIVNGWVVKTCLQTLWACRRLKIPCVVRGESNNLRPRSWWKRFLQRLLVSRFDAMLSIGEANREFYRSHQIPDERIFRAPYCVENDRFSKAATAAAERRTALRTEWGIAESSMCFLFCGKFETKKHPAELLQAFHAVVRDAGNVHLLMVGDGALRSQCEEMAREHHLPVTFAGFLNQTRIIDAYVASDLLVLPSDHGETWGLVVNEAMACGRPAIVSNQVGCSQDLIIDGKTGWVFKFGDFEQLSHSMSEIARSGKIPEPMQSSCRSRIAEYSPLVASHGIIDAVRYLIRRTSSQ